MSAQVTSAQSATAVATPRKRPVRPYRGVLHVVLVVLALLWLFPLLYALLASLRDYSYTAAHGYVSWGGFTVKNYVHAWEQAQFGQKFINSAIITIPAVVLTLLLASSVAFVIARFNWKFNIVMLGVFTAANLLPPQALLIPIFKLFQRTQVPYWFSSSGTLLDSYWGLIAVNVAFQTGFCTFVLSNYMKTLPKELYESAMVDGANIWLQYSKLTLPLIRPALAALTTLEVTWIYNEYFWATVLLQSGSKYPITSSLNNLKGEFFTDNNLVSAGSMIVAVPTIVIYFVLQKQFVSGLTLGATKG